jgi:hypothetical protein
MGVDWPAGVRSAKAAQRERHGRCLWQMQPGVKLIRLAHR